MYGLVKTVHLAAVTVTLLLFLLRSVWAFQGSPLLRQRIMRWLPHANDTILLVGAIATAATVDQWPFIDDWLTAKLAALVMYIGCAWMALWRSRHNGERALWFTAALASFIYMVGVARCHDPWLGCIGQPEVLFRPLL